MTCFHVESYFLDTVITSAVAQLCKTPDKNDQNDDERSVSGSNLVTKGEN